MPSQCVEDSCSKPSIITCSDCKKSYCREHLHLHTGRILKPLDDQIALLSHQHEELKIKDILQNVKKDIEQTRKEAHRKIDEFYNEHTKQMEEKLQAPGKSLKVHHETWNGYTKKNQITHQQMEELQREIFQTSQQLVEIRQIRDASGNPTFSIFNLNSNPSLENQKPTIPFLKPIPVPVPPVQPTSIETITPIVQNSFDGQHVQDLVESSTDFSRSPIQSREKPKSTIAHHSTAPVIFLPKEPRFHFPPNPRIFNSLNRYGVAMACNKKHLLMMNEDKKLNLLNSSFKIIQSFDWPFGTIHNLHWISLTNEFLVVTDKRLLYLVDASDISAAKLIHQIPEANWWSPTSSDRFLFISTYGKDPAIVQFDPKSEYRMMKQLKSPYLCENNEYVHQIEAFLDQLFVIISNPEQRTARCDIRSLKTFQIMSSWLLTVPERSYQARIRFCILPNHEYLIIYENYMEFLHLDQSGVSQVITHPSRHPLWNVMVMSNEKLIIRTDRYMLVYSL